MTLVFQNLSVSGDCRCHCAITCGQSVTVKIGKGIVGSARAMAASDLRCNGAMVDDRYQ